MFLNPGDRHSPRELQLAELIAGYEEFNDFDTTSRSNGLKPCALLAMVYAQCLARPALG